MEGSLKNLKKSDRLIDLETGDDWTFDCRTRAPDGPGVGDSKPVAMWTYVVYNKNGERRFIPESKMATTFRLRDASKASE